MSLAYALVEDISDIAARALATYLIPGCVGRGVRLGSENSSGGGDCAGVWKSGNLEIWGPGNQKNWIYGDLEIQKCGVKKIKNLKIQVRSAQNVGKVWISRKKSSWPYLGPSEAIFSMDRKNQKMQKSNLFSLVGQWALFTRCGPLMLSTRGGEIGSR